MVGHDTTHSLLLGGVQQGRAVGGPAPFDPDPYPDLTPTLTPTLPDVRWDGYHHLDIRGTTHPFDPDGSHMLVF